MVLCCCVVVRVAVLLRSLCCLLAINLPIGDFIIIFFLSENPVLSFAVYNDAVVQNTKKMSKTNQVQFLCIYVHTNLLGSKSMLC